jgi:hypothetical protein
VIQKRRARLARRPLPGNVYWLDVVLGTLSGLNAHFTLPALTSQFAALRAAVHHKT